MNRKVDEYIEKQKSPQKEICQKLRKIILKTFPDIKEELKWGTPWYEGKYYIVALRDHLNMGFTLGGLLKKSEKLLEGTGEYMRHIKIYSLKDIDEKKIIRLVKMTTKDVYDYRKRRKNK